MYLVRLDTFSKVSYEFMVVGRLAIERYFYGLRDTIWEINLSPVIETEKVF